MGTRIVFGRDHDVVVREEFDKVKRDIQANGPAHRLLECHPHDHESHDVDRTIYVNRAAVLYIEQADTPASPEAIEASRGTLKRESEDSPNLKQEVCRCRPQVRHYFQGVCTVCHLPKPEELLG